MTTDLDKGGRSPQVHRVYLGPSLGWIYADEPLDIEMSISNGLSYISPGIKAAVIVPEWVTVRKWVLLAEASGNLMIDVWKISLEDYLAGTVPTAADSITGSDIPIIFNQVANSSTALTGWTTFLEQNDVLVFNVVNATSVTKALSLIHI